uniref:Uncharacterized protein n=1 Tax=Rhipicephalus microplus TaxID=6941 RepID=A0A6G5A3I9_RHIMP
MTLCRNAASPSSVNTVSTDMGLYVEHILVLGFILSNLARPVNGKEDHVVGRQCDGSDQCEPFSRYCCVISSYRHGLKGKCQKRPSLDQPCSITMLRSNAYNNYYALTSEPVPA